MPARPMPGSFARWDNRLATSNLVPVLVERRICGDADPFILGSRRWDRRAIEISPRHAAPVVRPSFVEGETSVEKHIVVMNPTVGIRTDVPVPMRSIAVGYVPN